MPEGLLPRIYGSAIWKYEPLRVRRGPLIGRQGGKEYLHRLKYYFGIHTLFLDDACGNALKTP